MSPLLSNIINRLSPYTGIEKIFLLAEQTTSRNSCSIFMNQSHTDDCFNRYLFLALVNETVANKSIEDLIESRAGKLNPVTTWVMKETTFTKTLYDKNYFSVKVNSAAPLLFNAGNEEWLRSLFTEQGLQRTPIDSWLNRSNEFMAGAQLYLLRKQTKMAAFCLHQAAEQAYTAIIYQATGLRPETHNLLRLHLYASFFTSRLYSLFPDHILREECLLHQLQKAYIEARYTNHFHLPAEKINILCEKIHLLYGIAAEWSPADIL